MVKIGVLRLIKIILRWSTFDIETRILHNSHWINRIWIGIQLDLIVFKSYFKYSWGGYECIIGFRGNCHVSYSRYMFWCTTRVTISEKVKHWDFSLMDHESWSMSHGNSRVEGLHMIENSRIDQPTQQWKGRRSALCGNLEYFLRDLHPMYNSSIKVTQKTF